MGKMIENIALSRGHHICCVIDPSLKQPLSISSLRNADIAIEFSTPESAFENYKLCFKAKLPVVSGTTGWLHDWDKLIKLVNDNELGFFYASNFSLGLKLVMKLNAQLAKLMSNQQGYTVHIEETHHVHKKDAPSGTAISLAKEIEKYYPFYHNWILNETGEPDEIPIYVTREGKVPGKHSINWVSENDKISLNHESFGREGFATGAILAAEYLIGRKGIYSMDDLMKSINI